MENLNNAKKLNIVVPMAGKGSRFQEAGYTFPKPLIDINGKTMIEVVVNNLKPKVDYKFIFIGINIVYLVDKELDIHLTAI